MEPDADLIEEMKEKFPMASRQIYKPKSRKIRADFYLLLATLIIFSGGWLARGWVEFQANL